MLPSCMVTKYQTIPTTTWYSHHNVFSSERTGKDDRRAGGRSRRIPNLFTPLVSGGGMVHLELEEGAFAAGP